MSRQYIAIFSEQYCHNAKPRRNEDEKELDKTCWACGKNFLENEPIHIGYCGNTPRRRHVSCAIEKKVTTPKEARQLWDEVAQDMHVSFTAVMKRTLAYQLYLMHKNEQSNASA